MMKKSEFARYLEDKKELIDKLDIRRRNLEFQEDNELITAVVGPRRCGKTYLFFDHIKRNEKRKYCYINFEDIELEDASNKDILELMRLFEEIRGYKPASLYLDEIQNVYNWEKSVRQLYENKDYDIFVTGSSSKLLSQEIATQLRGRATRQVLFPLSFIEYLGFYGWEFKKTYSTSEENRLKKHLDDHLKNGGFPDIVLNPGLFHSFFEGYVDLVVYRDLVERHSIRNIHLLRILIRSAMRSYSKEFSINKIFKTVRSQGIKVSKKTLYNYFEYLQDALFAFSLEKHSYSTRTSKLSIPKIYLCDTGLSTFSGGYEPGRAMENAVYLELKRRLLKESDKMLFYWKSSGKEVDFVITDADRKITALIQVTLEVGPENHKREIESLVAASSDLGCKDLTVITWDQEDSVTVRGNHIDMVPLWKWLLTESDIRIV